MWYLGLRRSELSLVARGAVEELPVIAKVETNSGAKSISMKSWKFNVENLPIVDAEDEFEEASKT
jgi:hypothetical protein